MASRNEGAAAEAAKAASVASEAGRVLQQQRQTAEAGGDVPAPRANTEPRPDAEVESQLKTARENHPHKLTMEEIRRKRADQDGSIESLEKKSPTANVPPTEPAKAEEPAPEAKVETQPAVTTDPAAPATDAVVQQPVTEQPKLVKVKIDGVESEVPEAEVEEYGGLRPYQIAKATEARMKANADALAETRRTQAALVEYMKAQVPQTPKPTTDQILAKVAANRFGSDEDFSASLREFVANASPHVDQNAVVLQATASIKRDSAMEQFNKEFQDVTAQPLLKGLIVNIEQQRLAQYVQNGVVNWQGLAALDWGNFYRTIGNEVRSVTGSRQSQSPQNAATTAGAVTTTGTPSQVSEKEARKASIVTLPTASARAELPQESKPETREESLNRMKKSRGQPLG